ncbi:neuraminidase-like domain-containing protein [Falsiroseomonas sp. HC035]|uniref:neuraminidase-like domain-containing protein n=1 Tax=Falsiroseomonas sp. HC035 TaxID=3390999 RepID=UPI003D3167AD
MPQLTLNAFGGEVSALQGKLKQLGVAVPPAEAKDGVFGSGTKAALMNLQGQLGVAPTGIADEATQAALEAAAQARAQGVGRAQGRVVRDDGAVGRDIEVALFRRSVGGALAEVAREKADEDGFYSLPLGAHLEDGAEFELRLVKDGVAVPAAGISPNPAGFANVNLVAPAPKAVGAEFTAVSGALKAALGVGAKLSDIREEGDRRDIDALSEKTGWDPRVVALAASAARLSEGAKLPEDAAYALLRVGLPTDPLALASVGSEGVKLAIGKSVTGGVAEMDAGATSAALNAYAEFARETLATTAAPGQLAAPRRFAEDAGLGAAERAKLERLAYVDQLRGEELWKAAEREGFDDVAIATLKLQGKLAALTQNNPELVKSLQADLAGNDVSALAERDLHRPAEWKKRLETVAGGDAQKLKGLVPMPDDGADLDAALDAYSARMARSVRLSFPTAVAARMVENAEIDLGPRHAGTKAPVVSALRAAAAKGFDIDRQSVSRFVRENEAAVFGGMGADEKRKATDALKSLQRIRQVTPDDETAAVLLKDGFTSALEIAQARWDDLLVRHEKTVGRERLEMAFRKARQVSLITYNVFNAVRSAAAQPALHATAREDGNGGEGAAGGEDRKALLAAYPTLEALFGSQDFAGCEGCSSVTSPAAHLVDLLRFLDPGDAEWGRFLDAWKLRRGEDYGVNFLQPFEALMRRRPDVAHLPLTCENTETALPYIDLANGVLEWSVAKGRVEPEAFFDVGEARSEDLVAEPHRTNPDAYAKLAAAVFPAPLPFDLPLETARAFFAGAGTTLADALSTMRAGDELDDPAAAYGLRAVASERLGVGPLEAALLTDQAGLDDWFRLYGFGTEAEALKALASAQELARRLAVSYEELASICRTWFVNPAAEALALLPRIGVAPSTLAAHLGLFGMPGLSAEQTEAVEGRLKAFSGTQAVRGFDAVAWAGSASTRGKLAGMLALTGPASSDFSKTSLAFLDGKGADGFVYARLSVFVRLWRRLGWTVDETDRALRVLIPAKLRPVSGALGVPAAERGTLGAALRAAILHISHMREAAASLNLGRGEGNGALLALWSDMDTRGPASPYARMFLRPRDEGADPAFDHPLGEHLAFTPPGAAASQPFGWDPAKPEDIAGGNVPLRTHLAAALGAFRLSAAGVEAILLDVGVKPEAGASATDSAALNLATLSALHRHALLARSLRISVSSLLALKRLTGVDPFAPLPDDEPATAAADRPLEALRFIRVAGELREAGVRADELDWLLRHRFDPAGARRPDPRAGVTLMRSLGASIARIAADHAAPAEPLAFTDERIAAELSLAVPAAAADAFMASWTGGGLTQVDIPGVAAADALVPALFRDERVIAAVAHLGGSGTQRLVHRGFATAPGIARLKALAPGNEVLEKSLDAVAERQAKAFASAFGAFLEAADAEALFAPLAAGGDEEAHEQARRGLLARRLLPFLRRRLSRVQAAEAMAAATGADPALVESFINDVRLLAADGGGRLADALEAAAERGLDAVFSPNADGSAPGAPLRIASGDTSVRGADGGPLRPPGTNAIRLDGWVEAASGGAHRFTVLASKAGTRVRLKLGDGGDAALEATADRDAWSATSAPADLKPGQPIRFMLEAFDAADGDLSVTVTGDALPTGGLDALTLYPESAAVQVARAAERLAKALAVVRLFDLSEDELSGIAAHPEDFGGFALGALPLDEAEGQASDAPALFRGVLALLDLRRLRTEMAGGGTEMADLLALARRTYPAGTSNADAIRTALDDLFARLAEVARRRPEDVAAAAELLGSGASAAAGAAGLEIRVGLFAEPSRLRRLWEMLRLASAMRLRVAQLAAWTVPNPDARAASGLRDAVRAGFDAAAWRAAAKPIFDGLRQRRRDALVAYLMQRDGYDQRERLFEEYLMDPGMEPVVLTSPLQFAVAAVQTFVQRCLLNLEREVPPQAIDAERWDKIRRYPVWAGSRLIFLHPAQLLEPSLRDDRTHLFRELEETLLQGEVTEDRAEAAFMGYLRGLEEIARLQVVSLWTETDPRDSTRSELHVLARTMRAPRRHFYRTARDGAWRPWVPVDVEIEGDLACVLPWRGRTFVFWVTYIERAPRPDSGTIESAAKKSPGQLVQRSFTTRLNWAEFLEGAWNGPFSADAGSFTFGGGDFNGASGSLRPAKEFDSSGRDRAVILSLSGGGAIRLTSTSAPPTTVRGMGGGGQPYDVEAGTGAGLFGSGDLTVKFISELPLGKGEPKEATETILGAGGGHRLVVSNPSLGGNSEFARLSAPFFYEDVENLLFVSPTLTVETLETYAEWVPPPIKWNDMWKVPKFWDGVPVLPQIPLPRPRVPLDAGDPAPWMGEGGKPWIIPKTGPGIPFPMGGIGPLLDPLGPLGGPRLAGPDIPRDWLTTPGTVVAFGDRVVGRGGALDLVRVGLGGSDEQLVAVKPSVGAVLDAVGANELVRDPGRINAGAVFGQAATPSDGAAVLQPDAFGDAFGPIREEGGFSRPGRVVGHGGLDVTDIRRINRGDLLGGGGFTDFRRGAGVRLGGGG